MAAIIAYFAEAIWKGYSSQALAVQEEAQIWTHTHAYLMALVDHLAVLALHIGGLQNRELRRLWQEVYAARCDGTTVLFNGRWEEWFECYKPTYWESSALAILTDRVQNKTNPRVTRVVQTVNELYRMRGWRVYFPDPLIPSMRMVEMPPTIYANCNVTHERRQYNFGAGFTDADIELFLRLRFLSGFTVNRVFEIGNGFGYSTLVIARIFRAPVHVIDAEVNSCSSMGTLITLDLAKTAGFDVKITRGFSPGDVPSAARQPPYDLIFVDGEHTVEQLLLDLEAVIPLLANPGIIVLHDVDAYNLHGAIQAFRLFFGRGIGFRYLRFVGHSYHNLLGTGLLVRGLEDEAIAGLGIEMT